MSENPSENKNISNKFILNSSMTLDCQFHGDLYFVRYLSTSRRQQLRSTSIINNFPQFVRFQLELKPDHTNDDWLAFDHLVMIYTILLLIGRCRLVARAEITSFDLTYRYFLR